MKYTDKQYEFLREEIMNNANVGHNLLTISYVAIGAILAYVYVNLDSLTKHFELPLLFIPVFIVLFILFFRLRLLQEATLSLSAYIEVFLEPNLEGLEWETNLYKAKHRKNPILRMQTPNLVIIVGVYCLFIYTLVTNFSLANLLIAGSLNTIASITSVCLILNVYSNKVREDYVKEWKRIRDSKNK